MILGIDLGTTYSVGAYIDDTGEPRVITNMEGSQTTPSVVFFENETSVIVGQAAKENSVLSPQNVVSAVKSHMGEKKTYKSTYGNEYTPETISSFILKKIVSDAEKQIGETEGIKDVIVTIPAYFTDAQRVATEDAVKLAGLNLVATINEPTAAALYYATSTKLNHANIMVYDLGGGTFDVTIIRIDDDDIVVKSTGGLSKVGGRFFDEKIVEYVCDYIEEKFDVDIEDEEYADAYQELYERVEKAKIQLSNREKVNIVVSAGNIRESVEFTRKQLDEIVEKLYKRTEFVVKKALKDADLQAKDLDKILLVGGSSRIPYIEGHLVELVGKEPSRELHPDLVVAQGAALYGEQLSGSSNEKVIHDVCSHSIGIITLDPVTYQKKNSIQIKRNSPLPVKARMPFRTAVSNQTHIELSITEGEFEEISDVVVISATDVALPEMLPEGTRGEVHLELDKAQLVHVYISVPAINYEQEFSFERKANLSDDDIEALKGIIADYEVN